MTVLDGGNPYRIAEREDMIELYIPTQREVIQEMAHTALELEGFSVMETVVSPWEELRASLEHRITSQPGAIDAVVEALEAFDMRMPNDPRPMATLAFLGPTGVGKSETAKALADIMGYGAKLVKIDCSDFSKGHEVTRLLGAPPSYIGFDSPSLLSKENVERPGTVILFDEIEKGSDNLFNVMLQIMEDGKLQLSNGQVTDFRNAFIIITSNLGAKEMAALLSSTPFGLGNQTRLVDTKQLEEVAKKKFRAHFRPEFINRLTKMVVFHPLDDKALGKVLDTKLDLTNMEYESQLGVRVSLSDATRGYLVALAAQDRHMGARPLVRALDTHVWTALGRYRGAGAIPEGTHIKVFHASEVARDIAADESPLVFASRRDASLRKLVSDALVPMQHEQAPESFEE